MVFFFASNYNKVIVVVSSEDNAYNATTNQTSMQVRVFKDGSEMRCSAWEKIFTERKKKEKTLKKVTENVLKVNTSLTLNLRS